MTDNTPDIDLVIKAIKKHPPADRQHLFQAVVDDVGLFWQIYFLQQLVTNIQAEGKVLGFTPSEITTLVDTAQNLEGVYYQWTNAETEKK